MNRPTVAKSNKSEILELIRMNPEQLIKKHTASGNNKLPEWCAIYNLGSAFNCPSDKLSLCKLGPRNGNGECFAWKNAERVYPNCLPYRERQTLIWLRITAQEFAQAFINANRRKRNKWTELRFNESGDLWGQKCLDKMEEIARLLTPHGITVYTYTARKDLDLSNCRHLSVNGSDFMSSNGFYVLDPKSPDYQQKKQELIDWAEKMGYTVVNCQNDCSICHHCKTGKKLVILQDLH